MQLLVDDSPQTSTEIFLILLPFERELFRHYGIGCHFQRCLLHVFMLPEHEEEVKGNYYLSSIHFLYINKRKMITYFNIFISHIFFAIHIQKSLVLYHFLQGLM